MKTLVLISLLLTSFNTFSQEKIPLIDALIPSLKLWGHDRILVSEVKSQNLKNLSLDTIKVRDVEWRLQDGINSVMKTLMTNKAAMRLLELEKSEPFFFEIFLMDNQGANVAMTNKTSDYWQGDEDKWQKSFNNGAGAVHIGDVEFDESAQDYLVQVSVPVIEKGNAIGSLTIGINLDVLESK